MFGSQICSMHTGLGPTASACVCDVLRAQLSLNFRERKSKGRKSRKESEGDRENLMWKLLPQRFRVRLNTSV